MCVLYVKFGYKVRTKTVGYVAMCSAVLFFKAPYCSYILQDL